MKIIVDREFKHEGRKFEPGETVELPDDLARDIIEKGFAKNAEKIEKDLEVKPANEITPLEEESEQVPEIEGRGGKEEVQKSTPKRKRTPRETSISAPDEGSESSVWKELEKELEREPSRAPAWEPSEPGDQLLGEVTRTGRGPNGRLIEVETPQGENYILWERVALKDLFDRVRAGDKIGVRFLGKEESASGRSYYNFRTALRR